jgi:hypothetical protein
MCAPLFERRFFSSGGKIYFSESLELVCTLIRRPTYDSCLSKSIRERALDVEQGRLARAAENPISVFVNRLTHDRQKICGNCAR